MTPMQFLIIYIAGAIATTMFLGAYQTVKEIKFDSSHLIVVLLWPFTWSCLLFALIFGIAYWIGSKLAEIFEDIID